MDSNIDKILLKAIRHDKAFSKEFLHVVEDRNNRCHLYDDFLAKKHSIISSRDALQKLLLYSEFIIAAVLIFGLPVIASGSLRSINAILGILIVLVYTLICIKFTVDMVCFLVASVRRYMTRLGYSWAIRLSIERIRSYRCDVVLE